MIDRSAEFAAWAQRLQAAGARAPAAQSSDAAATAAAAHRRRELKSTNQAFATGSVYVSFELDALGMKVAAFAKASQQRSLFEDSGAGLSHGTDEIKKKLQALSGTIQGLARIVQGSLSTQLKKHDTIVLDTLKRRYTKTAKTFQNCLQDRAKAVSSRQSQQVSHFGVSKVQLSAPDVSVFNPARNRHVERGPALAGPTNARPANARPANGSPAAPPLQPQAFPAGGMRRRGIAAPAPTGGVGTGAGTPWSPAPRPGMGMGPGMDASPSPSHGTGNGTGNGTGTGYQPYAPQHTASPTASGGLAECRMGGRQAQYDRSSYAQRSRALEAQNIESTVVEISHMFAKVAGMVAEHGEVIERIDENVDAAGTDVRAGQTELLKYYTNLSGERAFILKIFAVLIGLALFFMLSWR